MVTIVLIVSRKHFLDRLFMSLHALDCDVNETNLFVYVDGDYPLYEKTMNYVSNSKFKTRLCKHGSRHLPADVSSMTRRRRRIGEIHNEIKDLLITPISAPQYLFLIEDDTLVPPHALKSLMMTFMVRSEMVGFVTGVELGRWGYTHIGAWDVDNLQDIQRITSVSPSEGSAYAVRSITAAGLYCCLTTLHAYRAGLFEPFDKILGPDFTFGLSLARLGYRNLIDYGVNCVHMTQLKDISVENNEIVQIKFDRIESARLGWNLTQLDQPL